MSADSADAAFRQLVVEHAPYVWRVLRSMGVAEVDLPDVSQETFLIVHRRLESFEGRSALRSWIYGIALRVASTYRKRSRRYRARVSPVAELPELHDDACLQEQLERTESLRMLDGLLSALDEDLRRVFVLFEVEQLPMREIAAIVGCPLSTAYWRLNTAREQIKARLAAQRNADGTR